MTSNTISPFIRRFSSHKPEDLVQNPVKFNIKLNPWWATGFIDGEGSFILNIYQDQQQKTGWRIQLAFSIALHLKDRDLLERMVNTLGVGKIYKHGSYSVQLRVQSIVELAQIIGHIEKYPQLVITAKLSDYKLFKQAYDLICLNEHLNEEGLRKLVGIKSSINLGLSPELKEAFPLNTSVNRPSVLKREQQVSDPNWLAGFISAEGCFFIAS